MSDAVYSIGAVADLTGVPAPTLRAWERRYGIPRPHRAASGHRLYDDRDIDLVRRVRRLTQDGVPPRVAVERVRRAPPADRRPPPAPEKDPYEVIVERIVNAIERFDPDGLETELRRGLLLGSTIDVHDRVMVPVMQFLGERWRHDDPESIAQEHLTTEVMRSVAQDLHRLARPTDPVGLAVIACVTDELHILPLYAIAFRLARRRLRAVVLGAQTPPGVIKVAVDRLAPDLVALSCTVNPTDADDLMTAYGQACGSTPWIVGGAGAARLESMVSEHGGRVIGPALDLDAFVDGLPLGGR